MWMHCEVYPWYRFFPLNALWLVEEDNQKYVVSSFCEGILCS